MERSLRVGTRWGGWGEGTREEDGGGRGGGGGQGRRTIVNGRNMTWRSDAEVHLFRWSQVLNALERLV